MKLIFKVLVYVVFLIIFNSNFLIKAHSLLLINYKQDSLVHLKNSNNYYKSSPDIFKKKSQLTKEYSDTLGLKELIAKGINLYDSLEYFSAETTFLKAIKLAEKYTYKEIIAFSYHYLGKIESWKSNFKKSINHHKTAFALFSEYNNPEYIAVSNNKIANGFYKIGELDSALVYYKKNIRNRRRFGNTQTIVLSYQLMANLYIEINNYQRCYSVIQEGIKFAEEKKCKQSLAMLYFIAGKLFLNQHINKDIALKYFVEAKKLYTEINDLKEINRMNLSIASVYTAMDKDSTALDYLKSVNELNSKVHHVQRSQANYLIGLIFKNQKIYDSTLIYLDRSLKLFCEKCPEISHHKTLVETAKIHLIVGNYKKSLTLLDRAKDIAISANYGLKIVISYQELANYFQVVKNIEMVKHFLLLAHRSAKELGLIKNIKSTAEDLSDIFNSQKEFRISSEYLKIANQMGDSLANIEKNNDIAKLEMRFEIEKKEEQKQLEFQILQSEISKQKLIRNTSIVGILIFIIVGILLYKAYLNKKKDNLLLAEQKREIQEISKKLQVVSKRKLDFFTNISHEIRTPLSLIISPLQQLLKTNENKKSNTQLKLALNNTVKLKTLVNQILDLQKIDNYHLNLNISSFEIVSFCKDLVSSFEGLSYQYNCKLVFNSNMSSAMVKLDNARVSAIISNLLSNAFKFNKNNGKVELSLIVTSSHIKIRINDTGKGIPDEDLKKMGTRYYQVPSNTFSGEGTGLGLAYVKELVSLMQGSLEISSEVNIGTQVEIILPVDEILLGDENPDELEIIPQDKTLEILEDEISDEYNKELTKSILIVEDNNDLRFYLQDLFSSSYKVLTAKDGEEGKEMALKYIPDLILSDIMMPKIQGNELCKMLKSDISTSHIAIVLLTAKNSAESKCNGYDCGADDYIEKPFDSELLLSKVSNILTTMENIRKQSNIIDYENKTSAMFTDLDKEFLKKIITIIHENLNNSDFTVEILADNIGMHRRTLLRKFKALTGKSPAEIIKHTKMSEAAKLIRDNKLRVNEVAFMVGYEDTKRFSNAFKQFHGVPPSSFN